VVCLPETWAQLGDWTDLERKVRSTQASGYEKLWLPPKCSNKCDLELKLLD